VCAESLDWLARSAVPYRDGAIPARGGELFPVGAERQTIHFILLVYDQRLNLAEPHQVMPFPIVQVFRTLLEQLQGPAQVVCGQRVVCQRDAMGVRFTPLALRGLLKALVGPPDERGAGCR